MGTSFILLCVRCATPASSEWGACERCGSLLRFEYRQDAPVSQFTSGRLGEGEGIWRYGSVLPQERGITHGEGSTPLTELKALSMETASRRLFVKDEGRNPTGSLHDRGSASVVSAAKQAGATALAMTSNGSAGVSLAAYARRAGLEAQITLSRFVSANDVHECRSFG
ncbi:MAG: pyridoxal-phosphate dependent enzyme, partial [Acidobacteriaceae bacterium]|nr:pyridoxal-phosphate dependent enzyme [Acidobacteriaceae bacterium]